MEKKRPPMLQTRREFIRQAACAAVGTAAMTAAIRDFRFMNAAVAQSGINPNDPNDYKALVCIFLAGGNDSNNLVIPTATAEYNSYAAIRTPVLAIPLTGAPPSNLVLPITSSNPDGHTYGLHPACARLQTLFGQSASNQNKLAIVFNT